jgi:hypothetical protein
MVDHQQIQDFLKLSRTYILDGTFVKLSLSKVYKAEKDLKNIFIIPIKIKSELMLSFTYRYKTQDQVKNFSLDESIEFLNELLGASFLQALLVGIQQEHQLLISKKGKGKLITNKINSSKTQLNHNKDKNYLIMSKDNLYLQKLGVCDQSGRVKDKQQDKFRQINRYVELMSHWFDKIDRSKRLQIVDMGSGKGYLTFALYDYLHNHLKFDVSITGIELRDNLVSLCNEISRDCDFENLQFISKDINDFTSEEIDVIIALHACDTATDLAIYKGIKADAQLIVCAPCCHKQVRKDMDSKSDFRSITKHGIFQERQAEMLTDAIRSLLMEREGYKTKAFEFISNEHTRKNIMLVGRKSKPKETKLEIDKEIKHLKDSFQIQRQELEDLLKGTIYKK